MTLYKKGVGEKIRKKFGSPPSWRKNSVETYEAYHSKVSKFLKDMICDAAPEDARVYATEGSATSSVGTFNRDKIGNRTYILPDHLEIHEIKESFVCVLRPDGSSNCDDEETK
jgi:hypothetical protein